MKTSSPARLITTIWKPSILPAMLVRSPKLFLRLYRRVGASTSCLRCLEGKMPAFASLARQGRLKLSRHSYPILSTLADQELSSRHYRECCNAHSSNSRTDSDRSNHPRIRDGSLHENSIDTPRHRHNTRRIRSWRPDTHRRSRDRIANRLVDRLNPRGNLLRNRR